MKAYLCNDCKYNKNGWCYVYQCNGKARIEICEKYKNHSKEKDKIAESKSTVCSKYSIALCRFNYQIFNSYTAVFDSFLRGAGNITEAPPVADEARRCWRKTRSIAPAPRAIGDYVLRGLNGLRSKTHEPVLFERSEFTGECAEQLIESRKLSTAARRCGCRAGTARLLFFCRRFLFQIKRKCRNAGYIYHPVRVRSEGRS